MKFVVHKSANGFTYREVPSDKPLQVIGAARIFISDSTPTQDQMAALFTSTPVPQEVGSGQIRAAMIVAGIAANDDALDGLIEGALANIPDATQRAIATTLWRNASSFKRDNAFIESARAALGKTSSEIDDLFRLASTF